MGEKISRTFTKAPKIKGETHKKNARAIFAERLKLIKTTIL